jgi:predicted nucleotidyltransferase
MTNPETQRTVLAFLQDNERRASAEYVSRLRAHASQRVQDVVLFGSKVRGEAGPDSDLDLLVIVDRDDPQVDRLAMLTAARVSLEYDTLINTHVVTAERWAEMRKWQATLWRAVQRDGVSLVSGRVLS